MSIDLVNILVNTFASSGIKDTTENYRVFVQEFAKANNMKIYGKMIGLGGWDTEGYDFDTPEDELVFVLKHGRGIYEYD
jgi:hypothetical protein